MRYSNAGKCLGPPGRFQELELEFQKELQEAKAEVLEVSPISLEAPARQTLEDNLLSLIEVSPRACCLRSTDSAAR